MKKNTYVRWNTAYKELAPWQTTLRQMDTHNETKFGKKKIQDELVLEEAARYAHDNEMIYYVTILEDEIPVNYLEINKGFFRVGFLDNQLRDYMNYTFYGKELGFWRENYGDKLFLEDIWLKEYDDDTDTILKITQFKFKPDGTFTIDERDEKTNEQILSEAKNKIDTSSNWEDYPAFGYYESLIRKERGIDLDI
jgi:hypothetical protein